MIEDAMTKKFLQQKNAALLNILSYTALVIAASKTNFVTAYCENAY